MWKLVHLLYRFGKPGIPIPDLIAAGLECIPDTMHPLHSDRVIVKKGNSYELSPVATAMLTRFLVARGPSNADVAVDVPRAFVIMPFSQPWSDDVYRAMIEPAVHSAGLECVRGDTLPRVGDLKSNVWTEILNAGLVIADVTEPNVNVYYELGLAHALGRDTYLVKQQGTVLPADFGGAHFCEYKLDALEKGGKLLNRQIKTWAKQNHIGVWKVARSRQQGDGRSRSRRG